MTIYEKRNVVLRSSLTKEAIVAFQSCMEPPTSQDSKTSTDGSSQKELVVRSLLASDWVRKFEMILSRKKDLVSLVNDIAFSILTDETSFTQDLCRDSSEIEKSFQKSLNLSFEGRSFLCVHFLKEIFVGVNLILCLFYSVQNTWRNNANGLKLVQCVILNLKETLY